MIPVIYFQTELGLVSGDRICIQIVAIDDYSQSEPSERFCSSTEIFPFVRAEITNMRLVKTNPPQLTWTSTNKEAMYYAIIEVGDKQIVTT